MGRFLKLATPQFLQGTMYTAPYELMTKVLENDNQLRSAIESKNDALEQEMLTTPSLDFDKNLLDEIVGSYNSQFEDIANSVYNDVNLTDTAVKKMKGLQKDIMLNKLNGNYGAITSRYNSMQQFNELNKDLEKTDPFTYNIAKNKLYTDLMTGAALDPKFTKSAKSYVGEINVVEEANKIVKDMKANKVTIPDGKGYIRSTEGLSDSELYQMALASVMSNPQYKAYAYQAKELGIQGFFDDEGNEISPYAIALADGRIIQEKDARGLTDAELQGARRVANSAWRYGNALSNYASGMAYQQQDIKGDTTWNSIQDRAQRAAQHADNMAFKREELAYRKEKDQRDYYLSLYGGRGGSGSKNGKGGSGDNLYNFEGGAANIMKRIKGVVGDMNVASDFSSNSPYAKERLNELSSKLADSKNFRNSSTDLTSGGTNALIAELVKFGVDINNVDSANNRDKIGKALQSMKTRGLLGKNNQYKGISLNNINVYSDEFIKSAMKDINNALDTNNYSEYINNYYTDKANTESFLEYKGITDESKYNDIVANIAHNPNEFITSFVDDSGNQRQVNSSQLKEIIGNKELSKTFYYSSTGDKRNGDVLLMEVRNGEGGIDTYAINDKHGRILGDFVKKPHKNDPYYTNNPFIPEQTKSIMTGNNNAQFIDAKIENSAGSRYSFSEQETQNYLAKLGINPSSSGISEISVKQGPSGIPILQVKKKENGVYVYKSQPLQSAWEDSSAIDKEISGNLANLAQNY